MNTGGGGHLIQCFLSLVGCFSPALSLFLLRRYLHSCTGALHINRSEELLIEAYLLS
jgi:hypothetical protein